MLKKDRAFSAFFILFLISFFIPVFAALKVISMSLLLLYTCFYPSISPRSARIPWNLQAGLMTAFFLWLLFSFLYSDDKADFTRFLVLRLPLLIFPLTLNMVRISPALRMRLLVIFSFIVTAGCLITLGYAIYQRLSEGYEHWLFNDSLSFFVGQQSIYTSLLVNIAIYSLGYILLSRLTPRYNWLIIITLIFLVIFSFMLASRNLMVVLYLTILITLGYQTIRLRKWKLAILSCVAISLGVISVLLFSPKTLNRFKELGFTSYSFSKQVPESHYAGTLGPDQWNGANFRLAAWSCGWELVRENPVLGTGLGDKRNELNRVYQQRDFRFALATKKNVHNNYLDIFFSLGIIGLLLFLAGWVILPAVLFFRHRDFLAIVIHLTLVVALITEVYFDRSLGTILFAFFITFLSAGSAPRTINQ